MFVEQKINYHQQESYVLVVRDVTGFEESFFFTNDRDLVQGAASSALNSFATAYTYAPELYDDALLLYGAEKYEEVIALHQFTVMSDPNLWKVLSAIRVGVINQDYLYDIKNSVELFGSKAAYAQFVKEKTEHGSEFSDAIPQGQVGQGLPVARLG